MNNATTRAETKKVYGRKSGVLIRVFSLRNLGVSDVSLRLVGVGASTNRRDAETPRQRGEFIIMTPSKGELDVRAESLRLEFRC